MASFIIIRPRRLVDARSLEVVCLLKCCTSNGAPRRQPATTAFAHIEMFKSTLSSRLRSYTTPKLVVSVPSSIVLPVQQPSIHVHTRTQSNAQLQIASAGRNIACCAASATEQAGVSTPSLSEAEVEDGSLPQTNTHIPGEYQVPDAPTFPSLGVDQLFMVS